MLKGSTAGSCSIYRCLLPHFLLLMLLGLAQNAVAHQSSESFSRWHYSGDTLTVLFTISEREASRLQPATSGESLPALLASHLAGQILVQDDPRLGNSSCAIVRPFQALRSRPGFIQSEAAWQCRQIPGTLVIHAFFDLAAEHSHFASFETADVFAQRLLTTQNRTWSLSMQSTANQGGNISGSGFTDYLVHGGVHILSGIDHLVFLLALLLVCRHGRDVIWAVSGFTLGHSITLSLAALGMVYPNVPAVEATIGLTIALVAVERTASSLANALPLAAACAVLLLLLIPLTSMRYATLSTMLLAGLALFSFSYLLLASELGGKGGFRILITTLFGLVHGLGFAGAFLASELSSDRMILPLAGFNAGIELGQLALIGVMLSIGFLMRTQLLLKTYVTEFISVLVCGLGVFWFVHRGFAY
jgi:hypothetical protein